VRFKLNQVAIKTQAGATAYPFKLFHILPALP
jgi:hypothetical protein